MQDFLTDDELDQMIGDAPTNAMVPMGAPVQAPPPVPLFPLSMAAPNGALAEAPDGLLRRQVGGVPVWAWGLVALGFGGAGYLLLKKKPDSDEKPSPKVGDVVSLAANKVVSAAGWSPSRSGFAAQLERYFARKGQAAHVKVWVDADEASGAGLKHLSPLINIQPTGAELKLDQALTRFCRREGLNPVQHADGTIGMYPHTGKRGKEWEGYIDALRDDGQKV